MRPWRYLTRSEMLFTQRVFRNTINTRNVRIIKRKLGSAAVAAFGSISFHHTDYRDNFIDAKVPTDLEKAHLFVHEMSHVWQHYVGMRVIIDGLRVQGSMRRRARQLRKSGLSRFDAGQQAFTETYGYTLSTSKDLLQYSLEQQAEIIADYVAQHYWKFTLPNHSGPVARHSMPQLRAILAKFLDDPTYPTHGNRGRRVRARLRAVDR